MSERKCESERESERESECKEMLSLNDKLSNFVAEITRGRDESHGHSHMKTVAETAIRILESIKDEEFVRANRDRVLIVAWLHDVADHKYDKTGSLNAKMEKFVYGLGLNGRDADFIIMCVNMVSFSKEVKWGRGYYREFLPMDWQLVRDIVSDADKLEAIGDIGLERCIHYTLEFFSDLDEEGVLQHAWEHAKDKLLRLAPEYILTAKGRELAWPKHAFMMLWFREKGINASELAKFELLPKHELPPKSRPDTPRPPRQ